MKSILLITLLTLSNQGLTSISMDIETLAEGEVATLIYVLGCGEWQNFTFSVTNNQISASADVPESWFNCNIDPAPPQFWNRLPLTQLPAGNYILNITLTGLVQNQTTQLNFEIRGGTVSVPINGIATMLMLVMLILLYVWLINGRIFPK